METLTQPPKVFSVEEYLELEARSEVRHEYIGGALYALAGSTVRHNQIAGNVYMALRTIASRMSS